MILPAPDPSFAWRQTPSGPALVCLPLEAIAPHLFTTRAWRLGRARESPEAWAEIASALGGEASALVRLRQVHGATVVRADRMPSSHLPVPTEGDIVVSRDERRTLAVQGADCVPLLLADSRTGAVAAAHSGWRGMVAGVAAATVRALNEDYGARPAELIAAIGPSVGSCCYEVGPEVRQAFVESGVPTEVLERGFHPAPTPTAENPSMPGLPPVPTPGHAYLDGWAVVRQQLTEAGVLDARIFTARLCTASHPACLCSYRRQGAAAGRVAGVIRPASAPRG